ncbi:MAG: SDR family NAD(P)-dependent oxidoreductase [Spirochaetales bacterium]|nr:SDR family NAD(P)-dependent oxidoreductase [Spirochaetales bacterium]
MDRIVLITDVDTPLGYSLTKLYSNDGDKVIGTVSSGNPGSSIKDEDKGVIDIVDWHRTSPIEAKNLVLSIMKKYKRLDETLIIQSSETVSTPLHDTGIADIDKDIDNSLKSIFFLTREIIKTYMSRKNGLLFFIYNMTMKQETTPIQEAIKNGISGFINQVLISYKDEQFKVNSIESTLTNIETLSSSIYKSINERLRQSSGKRIRFQQKGSLFSGFKK